MSVNVSWSSWALVKYCLKGHISVALMCKQRLACSVQWSLISGCSKAILWRIAGLALFCLAYLHEFIEHISTLHRSTKQSSFIKRVYDCVQIQVQEITNWKSQTVCLHRFDSSTHARAQTDKFRWGRWHRTKCDNVCDKWGSLTLIYHRFQNGFQSRCKNHTESQTDGRTL